MGHHLFHLLSIENIHTLFSEKCGRRKAEIFQHIHWRLEPLMWSVTLTTRKPDALLIY